MKSKAKHWKPLVFACLLGCAGGNVFATDLNGAFKWSLAPFLSTYTFTDLAGSFVGQTTGEGANASVSLNTTAAGHSGNTFLLMLEGQKLPLALTGYAQAAT